MSEKAAAFCDSMHEMLSALEGRLESLKMNQGMTWHLLQEKLNEVRQRDEARGISINHSRTRLERWREEQRSESSNLIAEWKKSGEQEKLAERAHLAEEHADLAMKIAQASIDEAETMILEAISARLDAESAGTQ